MCVTQVLSLFKSPTHPGPDLNATLWPLPEEFGRVARLTVSRYSSQDGCLGGLLELGILGNSNEPGPVIYLGGCTSAGQKAHRGKVHLPGYPLSVPKGCTPLTPSVWYVVVGLINVSSISRPRFITSIVRSSPTTSYIYMYIQIHIYI